jgi:hypothetical protein
VLVAAERLAGAAWCVLPVPAMATAPTAIAATGVATMAATIAFLRSMA